MWVFHVAHLGSRRVHARWGVAQQRRFRRFFPRPAVAVAAVVASRGGTARGSAPAPLPFFATVSSSASNSARVAASFANAMSPAAPIFFTVETTRALRRLIAHLRRERRPRALRLLGVVGLRNGVEVGLERGDVVGQDMKARRLVGLGRRAVDDLLNGRLDVLDLVARPHLGADAISALHVPRRPCPRASAFFRMALTSA